MTRPACPLPPYGGFPPGVPSLLPNDGASPGAPPPGSTDQEVAFGAPCRSDLRYVDIELAFGVRLNLLGPLGERPHDAQELADELGVERRSGRDRTFLECAISCSDGGSFFGRVAAPLRAGYGIL